MFTPFFPALRNSLAPLGRGLRSLRSTPTPELQIFFSSLFPDHLFRPQPAGANSRERIFTLQRTFWLFLVQALTPKTSLREACHHLRSLLELSSPEDRAATTGAFSRARGRFPTTLLHQALHHSKKAACYRAPRLHLLQRRDIRIIDGTTLRLADTPRNQSRFPQPSTQARGCGFPVMKVLALFCLRSGAAVNFATAWYAAQDIPRVYDRKLHSGFRRPGEASRSERRGYRGGVSRTPRVGGCYGCSAGRGCFRLLAWTTAFLTVCTVRR